jgi:hypothetical protein
MLVRCRCATERIELWHVYTLMSRATMQAFQQPAARLVNLVPPELRAAGMNQALRAF